MLLSEGCANQSSTKQCERLYYVEVGDQALQRISVLCYDNTVYNSSAALVLHHYATMPLQ